MFPILLTALSFLVPPPALRPSGGYAASVAVTRGCPITADEAATSEFDEALRALLGKVEDGGSLASAVDASLDSLDETFIPELGARISELDADADELPQLNELMGVLQERSQQRFERARDQLQTLLSAGEINKMDAQLAGLVKRGEIDAGFFYVLLRNMEDAEADGDEGGARLMGHIHTRLQELLEGQVAPALALLHKLTRLDQESIRLNLLRANLVPQTSAPLPGGGELPLSTPAPASVDPMDFAGAIETALDKVLALSVDPAAKRATAEEIKTVAKEARSVIEEAYDTELLDEFSEALTPVFMRALPPVPPGEPTLVQS